MPTDPTEAEDEIYAVVQQFWVGQHLARGFG